MFSGLWKTSPATSEKSLPVQGGTSAGRESNVDSSHHPVIVNESTGALSSLLKRSPKPTPKSDHGQDNVPFHPVQSTRDGSQNKTNSGTLGWLLRNPFSASAQQEKEKTETPSGSREIPGDKQPQSMQVDGNLTKTTERVAKSPLVPPRPSEEELSNTISYRLSLLGSQEKDQVSSNVKEEEEKRTKAPLVPLTDHEKEDGDGGRVEDEHEKMKSPEEEEDMSKTTPKNTNANALIAAKDDTDERVDVVGDATTASQKEKQVTEDHMEEKNKLPKKKIVKKKKNPFMPHVTPKGKAVQKKSGVTCTDAVESDAQKKSLMEQLNELRLDKAHKEDEDLEDLMEWWSTVKQWEQMPNDEDMTEKEEAKAFAVTAEKLQRGIRVFNQLFSERAEDLWQHVIDLRAIADSLDRFSWRTKVAQITGGSTSAMGGVATIAGLALAPVSMGTSLIVTAVGLGVATAGGLTSASAGISNAVNNSMDRKKVERIVEDYQHKMADLNKCMKFIKQGIENLRKFNLLKVKKQAYNRDFPGLGAIYEDGAMAGKAVLINANEIMRVAQIANVAGSTAARAVQIASMATGVLTGLFVGMDIYFVAKDSQELKKGAKSEFAAKIREVADQLHEGLVELNSIRDELSSRTPSAASTNFPFIQEEVRSSGTVGDTFIPITLLASQGDPESSGPSVETSTTATSSIHKRQQSPDLPDDPCTSSNQEEQERLVLPGDISASTSSIQEEKQSSGTSGNVLNSVSPFPGQFMD